MIQSISDVFVDEDNSNAYFAGIFENSGSIRIQEYGGITLIYFGSKKFLKIIKNTLGIGNLVTNPFNQLLIHGNAACRHLKNIYPYLLMNKKKAKLAFEYQEHINNRKGSRIDQKEQIYREKILNQLKKSRFESKLELNNIDNFFIPYFIGFFDSSAKINILNNKNDYWINIRLKSKFEPILLLFEEMFDLGHVYSTRSSSFRWELNYSDASDLLSKIHPFLFQNSKKSEIALNFYEYYENAQKPLNKQDIKFINSLTEELKNAAKIFKKQKTVSILVCEKLKNEMDNIIKDREDLNHNSLVKASIKHCYINKTKINKSTNICENKSKEHRISIVLEQELVDYISKSDNRSELVRKMIENYLNCLKTNDNLLEENSKINKHEINPLKLLKEIK